MSTKSSKLSKFLIGSSVALGTLYGVDTFYWDTTCQRTVRAFYVLSRIGLDYKFNFEEGKDIMALHERNAERLFNLLIKNKGLYVKLGQNIANQSSILPKVFQEKFNKLYDSAATDPWDEVERIMKEELGDEYTKNFKNFNKEPIASASIAQVHKAELVNGEKVAVKVQHYYINNQIDMDLWTFKVITEVFSRAFGVPFGFMAHYIADTMKEEVDFTIELANSKRTRKNIQDDSYLRDKVYVPQTFDNFCSRRVLVAEWCDGEPLFKVDELKKSFDVTDILHDYVKLFSKMIFQWGFVHSDPHPGNLLARYNNGKQQLVLLDHGLYVELPESLRHEYCTLWKSLFELNDKELKRIAVSWGIGSDQSDMFGSFALLKPYHKSQEKFAQMSRYEREKFMSDNFKQFFQNTEKFPLPLIFLGRTMRMVQSVNQRYRAPVNRINIFTREAVNGFYLSAPATHLTAWNKVERALRYSIYMITMSLVDISFYFTKLSQYLFGTKNVEDLLQEKMIAEMKEMGIENPEIDMFSG
jgi:aarF domain-containing kinase